MTKPKLLLVDDEKDFVETLAERLELRGFQVVTAMDGESALRIIENDPPQLVILDLMMPGLSGLNVLQQIKDHAPQIPVILLTGLPSTTEGTKGVHLGAYGFLIKPINIDKLIHKIEEAVQNT